MACIPETEIDLHGIESMTLGEVENTIGDSANKRRVLTIRHAEGWATINLYSLDPTRMEIVAPKLRTPLRAVSARQ